MRCRRIAPVVIGLLFCFVTAHAQRPLPLPATAPLRFERWPATPPLENSKPIERLVPTGGSRTRHALIGGAIGAVAGFALCTTISTLADDSAGGGVSFCPLDTSLLMTGGGFVLGAAIGWAI
jgi:hypothetical protein